MSTGKLVAMQMMESGSYDPEALGARCDVCVLKTKRDGGPVGPELRYDSNIALVAEAPGEKEVVHNRPLVGPSGMELNEALKAIGASRQMFNIHNAICCRPPENDLDKVMLKWQRSNKEREKKGEEPLPSPIECCRPRLINELWGSFGVVALGKTAYQAVTRKAKSILEIRGGPQVGWLNPVGDFVDGEMPDDALNGSQKINVLPTLHPSFVLRTRRWTKAFRSDLSRAHRWFTTGTLGWVDPEITINPTPEQFRKFLERTDIDYAVDVETSFDDPTEADLRTVGIGHEHAAMVVVLKSIETGLPVYPSREDAEIREVLRDFFEDRDKVKVAHNGGYFDRMVIKNHFKVDPKPMMDTILLHRSVESELPHKLAYVGSIYTDVTAWKDAHTAKEAKTDHELAVYNAIDCVVTARAAPKLAEAAFLRGQNQVVQKDHRVQQMCVGLHENGMFVDRRARDVVARELLTKISMFRQDSQRISGVPTLNPNSVPQLRDLLFKEWKLQPVDYTKLGDPSTNDECVRVMRTANRDNPQVVQFLDSLRRYRKVAKEYGTYVRRLIPYNQPLDGNSWQSDDEEEESERGLIMKDGRVRPDYNAHGTTSGRLSSSNPNAQNWPKHLRKLIIPAPGNVIVGADADQLELRIITAIAQIQVYLEAFNDKKDPHAMTAGLMFGKKFTELQPKSDLWDKLRKIAKSIKYASFYGSGDETVHGLVTSAEDDNGNLMYPDLTLREVSALKRNWLKGIPELPRWWEDTMEEYRDRGHIMDPVWGRRRDFLDGEAFNEIVNHPIQCVPGWSRVLTKTGYIPIEQLRGQEFTAWTGKRWATARVIYRGIKELHRVYTKRGMHFTCDDDHRGKFVGREGYEWRKFVEAGQGSRFAVDLAREQEFGQPMDELDAYVAGYWVGDGSSTPDGHHAHAVSFVVAHGDGPRAGAQMATKLANWASMHNLDLRLSEQTGCFQLTCHKGATEWLRSIGADPAWKAHTKRIPESIWRADLAARKAFLRGLLDADGYSSPDGAVSLHLCQHQLLQDTMVLARTVGIEGSISGPYASDKKGHESFRLDLNGSQTFASIQWGRECKLRTSQVGLAPRFECKRVQADLDPTCDSDRVIKSRIKTSATPSVSPYVLARMGAEDLYDHDAISSVNSRRIFVPVFTLEVDDPDHQYVVEGVISKNSAGAHIIHESTFSLLDEIPFEKWGPGTGLISQVHDALYVECPESEAQWVAKTIEKHMNRDVKGLDGVTFSAKAKAGKNWGEV